MTSKPADQPIAWPDSQLGGNIEYKGVTTCDLMLIMHISTHKVGRGTNLGRLLLRSPETNGLLQTPFISFPQWLIWNHRTELARCYYPGIDCPNLPLVSVECTLCWEFSIHLIKLAYPWENISLNSLFKAGLLYLLNTVPCAADTGTLVLTMQAPICRSSKKKKNILRSIQRHFIKPWLNAYHYSISRVLATDDIVHQ